MKKLTLRLEAGKPLKLIDAYGKEESITLMLEDFNVSPFRTTWKVNANGNIIEAAHGIERPLFNSWKDSWIAMCTPIRVHIGHGKFRPEFIVNVPNYIAVEGA